ncbi:lycopene cyclase domain-containing protein [Agromyces bracchium]|uniref:Lycopene cyclase domain-containing protein n=1 Tax=Agromyces bracchium TaxID=88376 RepID=A0A6I3M5Y9_9MICO|nr:lycopene cyclase domain-containing protein [Agromyces bracchium]
MTYLLISLPFLAIAAVAAWAARPRERTAFRRRAIATAVAAAVLLVLTAVFDSLIVGTGIVAYDDVHRSGWAIGLAPVEDFLYPLAGVLLLPAVWNLSARAGRRPAAEVDG